MWNASNASCRFGFICWRGTFTFCLCYRRGGWFWICISTCCSLYGQKLYIWENEALNDGKGLVDQAFGGETSKGPTWCSNRRKNKTLTNQFISKHKQIHNKNTNDNRQNQFPHIHLAGNWRLLLTSATTLSIYWGNLPSPSLATWVAIAVGWHDLFSSRRATFGQVPIGSILGERSNGGIS